MKGVLRTSALVGVLAAALPLFAQRSYAPSPSITSGTYMGYPAASILTPNNMRLGDSAPQIRPTGPFGTGAFAGHPVVMGQKSFAVERDHHRRPGGCRNCGGYSYFPIYYYDPYGYGYSAPVVVEDNSSLPNAGTFNSEQPGYSPNTRTEVSRDEQGGRFYERTITERSSEPLPPLDSTKTESRPAVTANGNENEEEPVRTLLIFKDGHRLEIANYAIMGSTLYVFAGNHRKIPLADLDLDATQKANEDRGTDFRLPVAQKPS